MRAKLLCLSLLAGLVIAGSTAAATGFFQEFKDAYGRIDQDLPGSPVEIADVTDFVYEKDVATFTFTSGTFYLLRFVSDRPTTAFFIGKGSARIGVPSKAEQCALRAVSGDTVVNESFESCFIRMADDLDLRLKEKFTFQKTNLDWKPYNVVKKAQGEYFFRPQIYHKYDNNFQLLRSHFERADDGYFWIDFNRYVYSFDPNRPEEVIVAYENEGGAEVASDGAVFQRREKNIYENPRLSDIRYETSLLEETGTVEMGGLDGAIVREAAISLTVRLEADSLRFVGLFLDRSLNIDSIYYEGKQADYHRRGTFAFIGLVLPQYQHRGDTLSFTLWYHGKDYAQIFPYVDNPQTVRYSLTFIQPKGYSYFMPGMGPLEKVDNQREKFTVTPTNSFRSFNFRCYAAGLDTLPRVTDIGITLNFLKWELMTKKYSNCFIPDHLYQTTVTEAFNYLSSRFGPPPGTFEVYVSPGGTLSMPGLMGTPQIACVTGGPAEAFGGFRSIAGLSAARQWFGELLQPATERENWLVEALPDYVSLLYIENALGATYYSNLISRKDSVLVPVRLTRMMPLAAGERGSRTIRANKGAWIFHMLRSMMRDLQTQSDETFWKFLREILAKCSSAKFTNEDFIKVAEKYYGGSLTTFFDYWLYGGETPEFDAEYSIKKEADGYYIDAQVKGKNVGESFSMPVTLRVAEAGEKSTFLRQQLTGPQTSFRLGPFVGQPTELVFNEFFSIMSADRVKKL
jgi:hypothetical protein